MDLQTRSYGATPPATTDSETFLGQQEGERILYVIYPHWTREFAFFLKIAVGTGGLLALRHFTSHIFPLPQEVVIRGYVLLLLSAALPLLWYRFVIQNSRTYLTDRRIVRFEGAIPAFQRRRSLFWRDVIKVRTKDPSWILKLMKVGHLEIVPNFDVVKETVFVPYAYYFDDLAAYMDKVSFVVRSKTEEEVNAIRPFVPKPKGQRYPATP